mmetsp:Transcript_44693/g.83458  ORF Transcript_44693/g.83458 Transcript_44693/m.83458 type:complete len:376 (-) Transcript_44693:107-1234(-)
MSKYAQNTTCGNTCPWGAGDDSLPDAFTVAAMKAARRRESKEAINVETTETPGTVPEATVSPQSGSPVPKLNLRSTRSGQTTRSAVSQATKASRTSKASATTNGKSKEVEAKMMDLISRCVDKKLLELSEPKHEEASAARSSRSTASVATKSAAPSVIESPDSVRFPEPLREAEFVSSSPEAVTMAGKRAQAQKLSDADLGKFDADQSRLAYLEMQKSAADARNKNRSALCFDYEPAARSQEAKTETMAGKRAQAQKLSDASLGKFDADQSRLAYLEMQKSAAAVRNKNRSAMCFEGAAKEAKKETESYPALLKQVEGLAEQKSVTMAGKRAQREKVSEASLGKFDADKSRDAYLDMQKSAEELRLKNRVGQGVF